ncbi:MAG: endolytic transglycosylase MltG [Firmicutes bacterium]|nr:endolytic transglycosylase MltG [Bacillota bacterium]
MRGGVQGRQGRTGGVFAPFGWNARARAKRGTGADAGAQTAGTGTDATAAMDVAAVDVAQASVGTDVATRMRSRVRARRIAAFVSALVLLCLVWALFLVLPFGSGEAVPVRIERGLTSSGIGKVLARQGLVRSQVAFEAAARLAGVQDRLKAGTYRLSSRMGTFGILRALAEGRVERVRFTVPEGYNLAEIASLLDGKGLASRERFLSLAKGEVHGFRVEAGGREFSGNLEGYLFPDTYEIESGLSEETIIAAMVRRFAEVVLPEFARDDVAEAAKALGLHGVVTIASMVEKEARIPEDRPVVAAVFYNRLKRRMPLQSCATVQYALGTWKERLSYDDLKVESPYNTYLVPGLPPGPIASPGLSSIRAALHPAEVDYLYFAADEHGGHIFSRTFREHQRALALLRRQDKVGVR